MLVHNKCDLPASPGHRPAGLSTSALRGEGIDVLLATIGRRLVPDPPPPGAPVPFSSEQVEMLRQWLSAERDFLRRTILPILSRLMDRVRPLGVMVGAFKPFVAKLWRKRQISSGRDVHKMDRLPR